MRGGGSWASRSRGWAGRPSLRGFSARGPFGRSPSPEATGEGRARLRGFFSERLFERFDAEGVGFLSSDNLPEGVWERLSGADADGDGRISRDELDAHLESAMSESGHGRRGHDRRPGSDREQQEDGLR